MRTSHFTIASLVVGSLLGIGCLWQSFPPLRQLRAEESPGSSLKTLYSERTEVLKRMLEEITASYKNATASLEQVHHAHMALLRAELEQGESSQVRIDVLNKIVELEKKHELHARALFEKGAMSNGQVNQAKVDRLNAEIALIRAKAG
jgi:hypothetical protein